MKVVAVVVTYNRLELLKKCIAAIKNQERKPDEIIVINNGSTDGTESWLFEQTCITYNLENKGGAAGFSFGIKKAYEHNANWIWLLDDDTIPRTDTLAQLTTTLDELECHQHRLGFLSSKVLWTDGSLHKMNRLWPLRNERMRSRFSFMKENQHTLIQWGTFVSMLLSAKAVERVGLPIKEFFIWSDDVEYAKRIVNSGLAGIEVASSVVTHKTPTNHQGNVFKDPESAVWKYRYGLRNELFTKRLHEGEWQFWYTWAKRMFIWPFHILQKRKTHRWEFIKMVWQTCINAINFRPSIEKVDRTHLARCADVSAAGNFVRIEKPTGEVIAS